MPMPLLSQRWLMKFKKFRDLPRIRQNAGVWNGGGTCKQTWDLRSRRVPARNRNAVQERD